MTSHTENITLSFVDNVFSAERSSATSGNNLNITHHTKHSSQECVINISPQDHVPHLQIFHLFDQSKQAAAPLKIAIRIAPGASLCLSELFESCAATSPTQPVLMTIALSENSTLQYDELQLCNLDKRASFTLGRDANLHHALFSTGGNAHSSKINVGLQGEGSSASLNVLFAVKTGNKSLHEVSLSHDTPNATSQQLIKGIIQEGGRAGFHGHVHVARSAQKTVAHQVNKNLLLGPKAFIDTRPALEIKADDVKCTHGATVGRISAEELFYLQSRSIPQSMAQQMLIRGFANEVIQMARDSALRTRFETILNSQFFSEAA